MLCNNSLLLTLAAVYDNDSPLCGCVCVCERERGIWSEEKCYSKQLIRRILVFIAIQTNICFYHITFLLSLFNTENITKENILHTNSLLHIYILLHTNNLLRMNILLQQKNNFTSQKRISASPSVQTQLHNTL